MRAGEAEEEEASAASRVLAILKKRWGDNTFTTLDVVRELAKVNSMIDHGGSERAAELADALGELIGKTLENPTARSLGKLFQKHLKGRHASIDEGNCVAVLSKIRGGRANEYKVEISRQPTGDAKPAETTGGPWRASL